MATSFRTILTTPLFQNASASWFERGHWPAKWITHPQADGNAAVVQAFRRTFSVDRARTIRIHVSADERYELFLDGQRIGRGPERGDRPNWFFETYDLPLAVGEHTLVARTWWLSHFGPAPIAQMTVQPGFVLAADREEPSLFNTGKAAWTMRLLGGYRHIPPGPGIATGPKVHIIGREYAWDFERGSGDDWIEPRTTHPAVGPELFGDQPLIPILQPATLPPMLERTIHVGTARHVQVIDQLPKGETLVRSADHLADDATDWDALLAGKQSLTIPPRTGRRVIIDLEDYYCAYPDLTVSGGADAIVQCAWAEALFQPKDPEDHSGGARSKGNRDQIDGKVFIGVGNTFQPDGGANRAFSTLWWEAGRYVELVVLTADEPLTMESLSLRETHYPVQWTSEFEAGDSRFAELLPITRRVMEMCSHETYMDCPYYEQLMYVGDTRLEALTTYACTDDDRLPRKALRLLDESRRAPGFTQSRYPCAQPQVIPPFAAWWVAMVHDYAMWRDDPAFVRERLPGVRSVLDTFMRFATSDGLVAGPTGWNFMDWVPGWPMGMPSGGDTGEASAPLNFQLAGVFKQAAELEDHFGEPELATLQRRRGQRIADAAVKTFWDEERGLFADNLKHANFSEHAQCLALLADAVDADRRARLIDHLFTDDRISRTTIYFSHYLFEACALAGRVEPMFDRLKLWFDLKGQGFKTTLESPEPSRSDCHAWGAHPMFHFYATILGIRPAEPGFASVTIRPQLGPLAWAKGKMSHAKGVIEVDVRKENDRLHGTVTLPAGVKGTLIVDGQTQAIDGTVIF